MLSLVPFSPDINAGVTSETDAACSLHSSSNLRAISSGFNTLHMCCLFWQTPANGCAAIHGWQPYPVTLNSHHFCLNAFQQDGKDACRIMLRHGHNLEQIVVGQGTGRLQYLRMAGGAKTSRLLLPQAS